MLCPFFLNDNILQNYNKISQPGIDQARVPRFTHLASFHFPDTVFFTKLKFVTTLCQVNLSEPFFQHFSLHFNPLSIQIYILTPSIINAFPRLISPQIQTIRLSLSHIHLNLRGKFTV